MRRIKLGILSVAVAATMAMPATAQAAPVTVGSPLTAAFGSTNYGGVATIIHTALPESGAHVTSPVSGVITSWHLLGAAGGPFKLRVIRQVSGGYLGAGSSAPVVPTGIGLETFSTNLPIQAGDYVGIDNSNENDKIGAAAVPGAVFAGWLPPLADGATASPNAPGPNVELAFNAVVQPAPSVSAISPTSGSIKGGTAVTISGADFAGVSGVSFGGVPAKSFTVASEGQINAVTPASAKAGAVAVTVTTVAGTSGAAKFTYKACVVPKLKGKKLKAAKKSLRKAGCKLGKVKLTNGVSNQTGKVVKQSPKPKKKFAPGKKVNVTLG